MSTGAIKAGAAYVEITARDQQLRQSLEANKQRVAGFVKNVAIVGAAAIVASAGLGIKAASDMEETLNKFNVVFGDNRQAMKEWADQWAADVGRSQRMAAEFLANTQDLLIPIGFEPGAAEEMSKQVTQLAVDVASFNNKLDADVMRDFHAALTGGGETVKKYGVVLDVAATKAKLLEAGIDPATATNQQKVWARWQIILGATTAAQGDAIRSGDAFANQYKRMQAQLEDLAASVGSALLPAMSGLLQIANAVIVPISGMIAANPELVTTLLSVAVAIGAVTAAFKVVAVAQTIYAQKAIIVAALSGPAGWTALAAGIAIATAATVALNSSLDDAAGELGNVTNAADATSDAFGRQTTATDKLVASERARKAAQKSAQDAEFARNIEDVTKLQDEQATSAERLAEKLELVAANQRIAARLERRDGRAQDGGLSADEANELRNRLIDAATGFRGEIQKAQDEIALLNGSLTETDITLRDMAAKGLPVEQAKELRAILDQRSQAELIATNEDEIKSINEEIALLNGSLTETELKFQRLAEAGLPVSEIEKARNAVEKLNKAKAVAKLEEAQEERKKLIVTRIEERQPPKLVSVEVNGKPQQFTAQNAELIADLRELVKAGVISSKQAQEEFDARQNEAANAIAKRNEESANAVRRESSVDLRSAQGSSLIVSLLNGQQSIEERKLTAAEKTAAATAALADQAKQVKKAAI